MTLAMVLPFRKVGPRRSLVRGSTVLPVPAAPEIPNTPTPDPGGTKLYGALRWVAAGAAKYDVYLDTNPVPTTLVSWHQVDQFFTPVVLPLPSTTYYWQVIAINDGGETPGPVWSFAVPSATSLIISLDGVIVTDRAQSRSETITDVLGAAPNTGAVLFDTGSA